MISNTDIWGEATVKMGRSPTSDIRQGIIARCIIDTVSDIALVSWEGSSSLGHYHGFGYKCESDWEAQLVLL